MTAHSPDAGEGPLPIIDLAASFGDDAAATHRIARAIDAACRRHGFFYVTGHGVPPAAIDAVFDANRRFFALPDEVKHRWHIERSRGLRRGYDPIGWQALEAGRPADLKESFYIGRDLGHDHPLVQAGTPNHGANLWPDEALVCGFQAICTAYSNAVEALGRHLMGLMALALVLPRNHFDAYLHDPMPVLRLLHYPPQQASQLVDQIGSGAHTDWGGITLLAQDNHGGLQVRAASGAQDDWLDATPVPGSFVVNLGDLMQRWTNDLYRSNVHRVINAASGRDRYSVAYFFDIAFHARVEVLPTCCSTERPARYGPISAGDHIDAMYRRTTLGA